MAEEMIEKALPSITDAVSRSDDEDDTSRRGVGMVPVIRGVNTVPARAIGHVLDFLDAEENRELREQRDVRGITASLDGIDSIFDGGGFHD